MGALNFNCNRADLAAGVNQVKSLVRGIDTLNPTRNIRVESRGAKQVAVAASSGDMMAEALIDAEVSSFGVACVPGAKFAAFVNALPSGKIDFSVSGIRVELVRGKSAFSVATADPAAFCEVHRPGVEALSMSLAADVLADMLRKVKYASSREKTRYLLAGVNFAVRKVDEGFQLVLTATDGRRLSSVSYPVSADREASFVLASDGVNELCARLKTDGERMVTVESDGKTAFVRGERWSVWTKLVDGEYPPWQRVVPTDVPHSVTFDRLAFADELKRAALAADSDMDGVRITFEDGCCKFDARGEQSASHSSMDVGYAGDKCEMCFNPQLLLDVLDALDDGDVKMSFKDGGHPVIIQCEVPFIGVVMPLREGK